MIEDLVGTLELPDIAYLNPTVLVEIFSEIHEPLLKFIEFVDNQQDKSKSPTKQTRNFSNFLETLFLESAKIISWGETTHIDLTHSRVLYYLAYKLCNNDRITKREYLRELAGNCERAAQPFWACHFLIEEIGDTRNLSSEEIEDLQKALYISVDLEDYYRIQRILDIIKTNNLHETNQNHYFQVLYKLAQITQIYNHEQLYFLQSKFSKIISQYPPLQDLMYKVERRLYHK